MIMIKLLLSWVISTSIYLNMQRLMEEVGDFFFQAEDGIREWSVTGVQTCALPISRIVGYYAPEQRVKPGEGLGHRGGAQAREKPGRSWEGDLRGRRLNNNHIIVRGGRSPYAKREVFHIGGLVIRA